MSPATEFRRYLARPVGAVSEFGHRGEIAKIGLCALSTAPPYGNPPNFSELALRFENAHESALELSEISVVLTVRAGSGDQAVIDSGGDAAGLHIKGRLRIGRVCLFERGVDRVGSWPVMPMLPPMDTAVDGMMEAVAEVSLSFCVTAF